MANPNIDPRKISMSYILGFSKKPFKDPPPPPRPPQPNALVQMITTPGGLTEWTASDGRKGKLTGAGQRLTAATLAKAPSEKHSTKGGRGHKKSATAHDEGGMMGGLGGLYGGADDDEDSNGWTPMQDARLKELKDENTPWAKIAEELGKEQSKCRERFREIKPSDWEQNPTKKGGGGGGGGNAKGSKNQNNNSHNGGHNQNQNNTWQNNAETTDDWSTQQDEQLLKMKTENVKVTWEDIAIQVGKPTDQCKRRFPQIKPKGWKPNVANKHAGAGKGKGSKNNNQNNGGKKGSNNQNAGNEFTSTWGEPSGGDGNDPTDQWKNKSGNAENNWDTDNNATGFNDTWPKDDNAADSGDLWNTNDNAGFQFDTGGGGGNTDWAANDPFATSTTDKKGKKDKKEKKGKKDEPAVADWEKDASWGNNNNTQDQAASVKTASWNNGSEKSSKAGSKTGPAGWDTTGNDTSGGAASGWDTTAAAPADTSGDNPTWETPVAKDDSKPAAGGWDDTGAGNAWPTAPSVKAPSKPRSVKPPSPSAWNTSFEPQHTSPTTHHNNNNPITAPLQIEVKPDDTFSADDLRLVARILQQDCGMVWDRVSWRFKDKTGRTVAPEVFERKITGGVEGRGSEKGGRKRR